MEDYVLHLIAGTSDDVAIKMHATRKDITKANPDVFVFSDVIYSMRLEGLEEGSIISGITVNGDDEEYYVNNGLIVFATDRGNSHPVFSSYFGFAIISISVLTMAGVKQEIHSEYVSIKVRENNDNRSIERMLEYIFEHQSYLLFDKSGISSYHSDTKSEHTNSIDSKLSLAEEIARHYDESFGYFSANSKSKVTERYKVDHIEKLQQFSPQTLQYISMHPEYLKEATTSSGIKISGKNVYPEKTLMSVNVRSLDIYENRIILGFLDKMIVDLKSLRRDIESLLERIPLFNQSADGYIHSSWIIFSKTKDALESRRYRANNLISKYTMLANMYRMILEGVKADKMNRPPRQSAVFSTIPHYNILFNAIYQWFDYTEYEFTEENFVLDFVNIFSLYELYVLCRIIENLVGSGATIVNTYTKAYPLHANALYKDASSVNTFILEKGEAVYSLYYQPVIYNRSQIDDTGIGLYRNTSYSCRGEYKGTYYTPDYVLKVTENDVSRYYIADAKFKKLDTIESNDIVPISFKYAISISPVREKDTIERLSIYYGKCDSSEQAKSIYDYQPTGLKHRIKPEILLIPMGE